METIAENTNGQGGATSKRPLGYLQLKIDLELIDQVRLLAERRTAQERRRVHVRDLVEEALREYLPRVERELAAERT